MRILIAPDKFKGSLGAAEVGQWIAAGVRNALPDAQIVIAPIADGGEGTAAAIVEAGDGEWIVCPAHDALGRARETRYGWLPERALAAIDMSAAAGLAQLEPNERDPLRASTFGVGEMLQHAAGRRASQIVLGLGGSATNDGGTGLARALGFHFLDSEGRDLPNDVPALAQLERIASPNELDIPSVTAACDVRNPLLGPSGATRVFGPQKGVTSLQLELLDLALARLAEVAAHTFGSDYRDVAGAGAAGGLGFGLMTFCGASIRSGFEVVAGAVDLRRKVEAADIVITGEGKLDRQTLSGKAPAGLAELARTLGKPVYAIVGQVAADLDAQQLFAEVVALEDQSENFRETPALLETSARELAQRFSKSASR